MGVGPSGSGRRDTQERVGATALDFSFPERGHGTISFLRPDDGPIPAYQHSKIVSDYFAHCENERRRNYGKWSRFIPGPGTLFPNFSYLPRQPRTIAVWHPRTPESHEAWRWFLVDKDAPPRSRNSCESITSATPARRSYRAGRHGELELRPNASRGLSPAVIPTITRWAWA